MGRWSLLTYTSRRKWPWGPWPYVPAGPRAVYAPEHVTKISRLGLYLILYDTSKRQAAHLSSEMEAPICEGPPIELKRQDRATPYGGANSDFLGLPIFFLLLPNSF